MAEMFRYTLVKPARLLFSSVTQKSAPRNVANAVPKFSGTFGVEQEDFDAMVKLMVNAIKSETGAFTNPGDYYLACTSGATAAKRVMQKAELDAQGKSPDDAFKIREKAEKRAELYKPFAGILSASSQFDVSLAKLEGGKIVDIPIETKYITGQNGEPVMVTDDRARIQAGKDLFYPGAYVAPAVAFKGYRRKSLDAKDGCTAFLQNVLYVRKGERLGGAGGPANSDVFGSFSGYSDYDPTALAPEPETAGSGESW